MASQVNTLQNHRLKAMVIPREHGAWGMLLVPLVTGAVVAGSYGVNVPALLLFVVAALAFFWMRTPVEAWLGTTAIKAQSSGERSAVVRVSVALGLLATASVAALFAMGLLRGLFLIGIVSAAAFALQAVVKRFGRTGRMPAQMIGAVGLTSTAAAAYYVSTGHFDRIALSLWVANWLFAGDQIHSVQVRIRGSRLASFVAKIRHAWGFLVGQVLLLMVVILLQGAGYFPRFTLLAFVPALARGIAWFFRGAEVLDVHKLGFSELAQAIIFGTLLCFAYLA